MEQQGLQLELDAAEVYRLGMWARPLQSPDRITELNITKELVIVTTEDPDFRGGAQIAPWEKEAPLAVNNIQAYDWQGNPRWNIADIVGQIPYSFQGCSVNAIQQLSQINGVDTSRCDPTHAYLTAHACGFLYLIDLQEGKLVQRISEKW